LLTRTFPALFPHLPDTTGQPTCGVLITQAAAEAGDPEAQYALGVLYANLLEVSEVFDVKKMWIKSNGCCPVGSSCLYTIPEKQCFF